MKYRISPNSRKLSAPKFTTLKTAKKGAILRRVNAKTGVKVLFTVLGVLAGIFFIAGIIGSLLALGYVGTINASLPDAGKLVSQDLEQSTKIYDRNGELLYTVYGEINREYVAIDKVPTHLKWAVLAAEDIDFYEHKGIDIPGIASAVLDKLRGKELRGASTLTQQLARNTVLYKIDKEDAFKVDATRKIKEMLVAFQLENKLTKDQILELYLNEIPLGSTNYGFQTASRAYFNKEVKDLSLHESAFLAGIIQSPTFYVNAMQNGNEALVKKRRDAILDFMYKYKDKTGVTEEEINKAKEQEVKLNPGQINLTAPHFVFYVIEQLEKQYGAEALRTGGLRVTTSLDLKTQRIAEEELKNSISRFSVDYGVHNGAIVIINPKNGEVLAMVGSVDYNNRADKRVDGNVNVAVMPRQMGSSVKPFVYLEAFHLGYHPGSLAADIPYNFGAYKPANWDRGFKGIMTMRTANNLSRNMPAIYTLQMIGGPAKFVEAAEKMGISTLTQKDQYGLSLAIGAGDMRLIEHTNAYAMIANKGIKYDPAVILNIKDANGKELFKYDPKKTEKRVYTEEEVFLLNWVNCQMGGRQDKSASGFYRVPGQQLCGKTGTTNGPKDLITMGYYPRLSVGVWTGNNNGDLTFGRRGQGWSENVPIVIMNNIMKKLVPIYGNEFYVQPSGVASGSVCKDTGYLAGDGVKCDKESTVYIKTKTPPKDSAHKYFPICKKNGLIPTNEAEARANGLVEEKLFLDYKLQNAAQQGVFETYLREKMNVLMISQKPAEGICEPDAPLPTVTMVNPTAGQSIQSGNFFTVRANITVTAPVTITKVEFYLDGTLLTTKTTTPYSASVQMPAGTAAGNHAIKAIVTDSLGRTVEASVGIVVTNPAPSPTPTPVVTTPVATPTP